MAHLPFQVFFLLLLNFSMSESKVDSPGSQMVSALKDESVALSCPSWNETDTESCYRFRWIKYPTDSKPVVIYEWPQRSSKALSLAKEVGPKGEKQLCLQNLKKSDEGGPKGQKHLCLQNLQKSDEGLYSCEIWKGWDRVRVKNTTLKLKICKTHPAMKAAPGTPVKLSCPVNATPEEPRDISWSVMKGVKPVSVASERVQNNGSSLVIQSVIASDGGWYRCNYTIGQTWECHDINLNVQEVENPKAPSDRSIEGGVQKKEESSKTLVAVVTSVIFGVIVAAVIGFLLYRRQKSRRAALPIQTAGGCTETLDGYESIDFTPPQYHARINSFYETEDEIMRTCECCVDR